jgi:hydroxypyruvate reductase
LLGKKLARGVISCPPNSGKLSVKWQVFHGGHPVPNEDSLSAARAALSLLNEANTQDFLIIYLVSGG